MLCDSFVYVCEGLSLHDVQFNLHVLSVLFQFFVTSFIWFSHLSTLSVPDEGYTYTLLLLNIF